MKQLPNNRFRSSLLINATLCCLIVVFFSCQADIESPEIETHSSKFDSVCIDSSFNQKSQDGLMLLETEQYTSESFYTEGTGWGYRILNQGAPYINQPHIPAVSGVKGFESEQAALKTADFAIYKISNGIVPPTISKAELDSLGVLPQ